MTDLVYLSESDYHDDDDDDDSFQSALETPLEDSFLMHSNPTFSANVSEEGEGGNDNKNHPYLNNSNDNCDNSNNEYKKKKKKEEEEDIFQTYSFATQQEQENFENGNNDIGSSNHPVIVGSIYWSENKDDSQSILVMGTSRGYLIIDTMNPKVIFRDENNHRSCSLAWLLEGTSLLSLVYQDDPRTLLYVHVSGHRSSIPPPKKTSNNNVITTTAYAHAILRVQIMKSSTTIITNKTGRKKKKKNDFQICVLLQNGDLLVHTHTDTSTPKFIVSTLFPHPSSAGIKNNNIENNQRYLLKPQMAWAVGWLWDCSDTTMVTKNGRSKIQIRTLTLTSLSNQTNEEITIETQHETSVTRIHINSSIIITCDMHGMACHLYQLPHGIPYRQFQLYRGSTPCTIHSIAILNSTISTDNDSDDGVKIGLWSDHGTIHVFSGWKSKPKHQVGLHKFWNRRPNPNDVVMIPATWKISIKNQSKFNGSLTFASDSKIVMATGDGTVLGFTLLDATSFQVSHSYDKSKSTKPYLAENILLW